MIDTSKPIRTIKGKPITIISTIGPGDYPLVGFVNGTTELFTWSKEGRSNFFREEYDIIND